MRILIAGATGFIGASLVASLGARGHAVVACVRRSTRGLPAEVRTIAVDYRRDTSVHAWLPRLAGIDVVINAVGILRESRDAAFEVLHHRAPAALFQACEQAGVRRVIQISALGADQDAVSGYHRSKHAADEVLRAKNVDWTIVQPSVVFGTNGASTKLFTMLASLPFVPLVGAGDQCLQPVHIDNLDELIVKLIEQDLAIRQTLPAVGPEPITMRNMLAGYRRALGLRPTFFVPIPLALIRPAARIGDVVKVGALSTETLTMLLRHNVGNPRQIASVLGRSPRALSEFISPPFAAVLRMRALGSWLRPLLYLAIAFMWISAGLVSWFSAKQQGLILLGALDLPPNVAEFALASACAIDVGLGIATLIMPTQMLWLIQLIVMVFYTAALSWVAPQLWLDPFGPLVKNIPIAVVLLGLIESDARRET